jgi:hypothetical protein
MTKLGALLLTVTLVASSCSSSDKDPQGVAGPSDSSGPVARGIDPLTEEDLVKALARGGIETFDEASDPEPVAAAEDPGPMVLTGWQAERMQRQLASGTGYVGRDLDALTGEVSAEVPTSVVLAAWISAADTDAAGVARELMGERDYAHFALDVVYPGAVVALFVNDLARSDSGPSAGPAAFVASARAPAGICSDMVNVLKGSLAGIVESLQVTNGAAGVLGSIWNTVVSIAASAAQTAIAALTAALIAPITKAIALVAVLSEAATLLDPWTLDYDVAPAISLDPGTEATVTAKVDSSFDFTWPADLKDCASTLAGVELPDPGETKGSPVAWDWADPYATATRGNEEKELDEAGTADFHFATLPQDPAELNGSPVAYPVLVWAVVERAQVKKLTDLIASLLVGVLPAPVRAIVEQLLGPLKSATQERLAKLVSVTGQKKEIQTIRYQPNPEPVPPVVPEDDECVVGDSRVLPDGTWKGPIKLAVTGKGLTGQAFSGGDGSLQLVIKNGNVKSGSWGVSWHSQGVSSQGGIQTKIDVRGEIHGNVKGFSAVPFLRGTWTLEGFARVNIAGAGKLPLSFSGKDTEDLRIQEATCSQAFGTFVPSFNAKGGPATFSGTAQWTGTRVD